MKKPWGVWLTDGFVIALTAPALQWRRETSADRDFLLRLFIAIRGPEFKELPDILRLSLLEQQFCMQWSSYLNRYSNDGFGILEHHGETIGKLYLAEDQTGIHIVDIALLPEWQNRGFGTSVLKHLCDLAAQNGSTLTLSVFASNPALSLYHRIGFREIAQSAGYLQMQWHPYSAQPHSENTALSSPDVP